MLPIRLADANDPGCLDALNSHNHLGPESRGEGLKVFHISPISSSLLPLAFVMNWSARAVDD